MCVFWALMTGRIRVLEKALETAHVALGVLGDVYTQ